MMKRLNKFIISLLLMIGSILPNIFAEDFLMDSTQLKETNLIFAEHEYLLKQDSINNELIADYNCLVEQYELNDSLLTEELLNCVEENKRANKSIERSKRLSKTFGGLAAGGWGVCIILILVLCL